jgi:flagellar FliJ protein
MADLHSLIRVRKHTVDEKQKVLSGLYREFEILETEKARLIAELEAERQNIQDNPTPEMLGYFGAYSEGVKDKMERLEMLMEILDAKIEIARDDMRIAFAELKKVEMTQEARDAEDRKEQDKKESDMLDEIALDGYRRKMAEEGG